MDDDLINAVRSQIEESKRRVGLSFDEAQETVEFSPSLLEQYLSADRRLSGIAAFKIEAFLAAPKNHPIDSPVLSSIAAAVRQRTAASEPQFARSDLRIALALSPLGFLDRSDVESMVQAMKGVDDHSVASEASRLLAIIGPEFIRDYLTSTERSETGGMGGPQLPLIREMASEALREVEAKSRRTSFGIRRR